MLFSSFDSFRILFDFLWLACVQWQMSALPFGKASPRRNFAVAESPFRFAPCTAPRAADFTLPVAWSASPGRHRGHSSLQLQLYSSLHGSRSFLFPPQLLQKRMAALLAYKYQDKSALPFRGASFSCTNGECAPCATSSAARSE